MLLNDKDGVYAPGDPDRMAEILVNLVKSGDMPQRVADINALRALTPTQRLAEPGEIAPHVESLVAPQQGGIFICSSSALWAPSFGPPKPGSGSSLTEPLF